MRDKKPQQNKQLTTLYLHLHLQNITEKGSRHALFYPDQRLISAGLCLARRFSAYFLIIFTQIAPDRPRVLLEAHNRIFRARRMGPLKC